MIAQFWEVIYDDTNRKMEVMGPSSDDTKMTNNVAEMIRTGMKVHCQTADAKYPKEEVKLRGYEKENNLYQRLITEYEKSTGKLMNRW